MNIFKRLKKPYIMLAPMVGITDPIFRDMCSRNGADYTYTEMINPIGLLHNNKFEKICSSINNYPYSIQIFGNKFNMMYKELEMIEETYNPHSIDINMGCPSKKVISCGYGSSLLYQNNYEIFKELKDLVSTIKIPITVKMRILSDNKKTLDFGIRLEKSGIEAISIHGRTSEMKYSGLINRDIISKFKKRLSIPIIANGDIRNIFDFKSMIEDTNCDGVMIGRAAIGNPTIFNEIKMNQKLNINDTTFNIKNHNNKSNEMSLI